MTFFLTLAALVLLAAAVFGCLELLETAAARRRAADIAAGTVPAALVLEQHRIAPEYRVRSFVALAAVVPVLVTAAVGAVQRLG